MTHQPDFQVNHHQNQAMSIQTAACMLHRFLNRLANPARNPTTREAKVLESLQRQLKTKFDEDSHKHYLKRLWEASYGTSEQFQRQSVKWRRLGFQQSDPSSDIRGGGELALEAMCYLFEKHPSITLYLLERRRKRSYRGPFANYPLACACITVLNRLCAIFHFVEPRTGRALSEFYERSECFWHITRSKTGFLELFVTALVLLDKEWDDNEATYMMFSHVIDMTVVRLVGVLQRLPADVALSPISFISDASLEELDTSLDSQQLSQQSVTNNPCKPGLLNLVNYESNSDSESDSDDDCDEGIQEKEEVDERTGAISDILGLHDMHQESRITSSVAQDTYHGNDGRNGEDYVDLLGLHELQDALQETVQFTNPIHRSEITSMAATSSKRERPGTNLPSDTDFFGSFGLAD